MTRAQILNYITTTHGEDLEAAGVELTDTPETLYYVLFDAMIPDTDEAQMAMADAKVAQLIADKTAAMEE